MKTIPLSQGKVAIVDDADYEWLSQWKWSLCNSKGYAIRRERVGSRRLMIRMHRLVTQALPGELVDHINGDTLDNRRDNLRICTIIESNRNRGKASGKTSRFLGVYRKGNRWVAQIGIGRRYTTIGCYEAEEDAAHAYDSAARDAFGSFARLNF